jgi:hypothetical protein
VLEGRATGTWDTWGNMGFAWPCQLMIPPHA